MQEFPVFWPKEWKASKSQVWYKLPGKNRENLDFVENSNFIREDTEVVARRCSGKNLQENTRGRDLLQ